MKERQVEGPMKEKNLKEEIRLKKTDTRNIGYKNGKKET